MSKKIYISPSSQPANTYAVGNTNEQEQCRKIASHLEAALIRCGFEAKAGMSGTMYTRVDESNAWGADLHIPIHTNACNGKVMGTRLFAYDTKNTGYKVCQAIMATLAPITPGESDGITAYPGLYEVKAANASTAYIEVGFHDTEVEAMWIIEHTKEIAEAICNGLCNFYGVKYDQNDAEPKPEEKPTEKPVVADRIYRVFDASGKQVGAYNVEANAFNMVREQLDKGGKAQITYGAR